MVQYAKPDSQAFLFIVVNSDICMVQYAKPAIPAFLRDLIQTDSSVCQAW